jgi:hypothetical protein
VYYILKKNLLGTEINFWRTAAKTPRLLRVKNKIIRDKMRETQTNPERMDSNVLNDMDIYYEWETRDGVRKY